jgi:cell division protein ZapA (FtsZ GTPase activity inhibitor)
MPDSGPTQGELNLKGGYNLRRKEESVDQAIENALDETVEELKKLAGL